MTLARKRRRTKCGGAAALSAIAVLWAGAAPVQAAGPPIVTETWVSQVFSTTTRLHARINPNGLFTTYHFDYITKAAYDANGGNFTGASRIPAVSDANVGSGESAVNVTQQISGLVPDTAYRYRVVAKNTTTTIGSTRDFRTQIIPSGADACPNATPRAQSGARNSELADCRSWELVSPVDKNGGQVAAPGELFGGGVAQAAASGQSVTYGSQASFAGGAGAPPASQYLASRTAGGWATLNITAPIFAGTYDAAEEGVPYQLFSPDLARGLLLNGDRCRGEEDGCAVANPPLAGTEAPVGYQNYYLREGGSFTALLGAANAGFLAIEPKYFELRLAGASPDLAHPVLSSCAALSANATEVPAGEGCDATKQNLYMWSASSGLSLVNIKPGETAGTPGAELAAQSGAISGDGSRIYFTLEGNLYLRASAQSKQADEDAGGEGAFEAASADGQVAYFTKAGHLWRYLAASDTATDITPPGGVKGVLGASADGSRVYFQDEGALKLWSSGTTTTVTSGADAALASDWPPTTGTARVSADGSKLLFLSEAPLSGFDNTDLNTGE